MGRQPEAAGKIQLGMIIGCALIEALTIYALVTLFVLQGKIS
jgi:F0F1-type ATP synthase membrane subunit c/vacuolar-type H+-ATPase subunit K